MGHIVDLHDDDYVFGIWYVHPPSEGHARRNKLRIADWLCFLWRDTSQSAIRGAYRVRYYPVPAFGNYEFYWYDIYRSDGDAQAALKSQRAIANMLADKHCSFLEYVPVDGGPDKLVKILTKCPWADFYSRPVADSA